MEDKFPIWKPALIVAVLALCIMMLYPPQRTLKPGLDLAGGTRMIYQVDVPEGMEPGTAVDQVISSLRKRVDPNGVRNLVWRRLAGNRFEIQMALATEQTKKLRKAYQEQLEAITKGNLSGRQLDRILKMEATKRDAQLTKLAGSNATLLEDFKILAQAYDLHLKAQKPVADLEEYISQIEDSIAKLPADAPEDQKKQMNQRKVGFIEQMVDASRTLRQTKKIYQDALDSALANNVDPAELQAVFALPSEVKTTGSKDEAAAELSPRDRGLESIKKIASGRIEAITAVADAYSAYESVKGPLDDPADLITLLRGSGVLEFRIAPSPSNMSDAATYRKQLAEKGPRVGLSLIHI
ncbi:MAG: hypothetical protein KUG81_04845 [Gammaproteobacteria bacterium]|nr:hypothetical protein [Gammaproteobacteria bacterium]